MAASDAAPGALPPELQQRVNKAIERGVSYLRLNQLDSGTWGDGTDITRIYTQGSAAFAGLALLECGAAADDPAIQKAARFVREQAPINGRTYETALAVLFLDRLGEPADRPLLRSLALRLAASQKPAAGSWDYSCLLLKPAQEKPWQNYLRQQSPAHAAKQVAATLHPSQRENNKIEWERHGDNSNTQFALLALWAARRYELPLESTVARAEQRFRSTQEPNGWGYTDRPRHYPPYGAMTCVGLLAFAVGRSWDARAPGAAAGGAKSEDAGVIRGLQALRGYLDDPGNTAAKAKSVPVNVYFLWSVQRVGVAYDLKTIGGKDWYRWGVDHLLPVQTKGGSWPGWGSCDSTVIGTCMALLFLKRADLMPDLSKQLRLRVAITDPGPPPDKRDPKGPKGAPSPGQATAELLPVDLGDVDAGATSERRFVLKGPQAFRVLKVEGADKGFAVEADSQPREAHTFTVTLRPDRPGTLTRTLRLRTDLPGREDITLTITARATKPR